MMNKMAVSALLVGALALAASVANAEDFYLIAKQFDMTLPDGKDPGTDPDVVPMWGFAEGSVDCWNAADPTTDPLCTTPEASVPGPRLQPTSDVVSIHLLNLLDSANGGEAVSIVIPGQMMPNAGVDVPTFDMTNGTAPGERRVRSFGAETLPNGGKRIYEWSALKDGTYLYHSGTHPQVQVQMGLYGAITRDAGVAAAGLIDNGTTTIDPATGLEWLDLTETLNLSYADALTSSFVVNDGYRSATDDEVAQLFTNAGMSALDNLAREIDHPAAASLLDLIGCTALPAVCAGANPNSTGYAEYNNPGTGRRALFRTAIGPPRGAATVQSGFITTASGVIGTFLVRPAASLPVGAYGYEYDNEVVALYSEIDPDLHEAVASGTYGTTGPTSTFDYHPRYLLVNGKAFTDKASATINAIPHGPRLGERTLLRMLNAGLQSHTPTLQGMRMSIIAEDGNAYPFARDEHSALLAPLKTRDAILEPNAVGTFALYDGMLNLSDTNGEAGGMLSFLAVDTVMGSGSIDPPVNEAPIANVDRANTTSNTPVTFSLVANDTDSDGIIDITSIVIRKNPQNGTVVVNGDGTVTYTPDANYTGRDTFRYRVRDDDGTMSQNANGGARTKVRVRIRQ